MADAEFDVGQLTEEQQLALQQFTSVTDANISAALPLLRRCEWNVQIAIARFFDGEPPEPAAEPPPVDIPPPQSSRRQDTLANGFELRRRPRPGQDFEPAPRIIAQPEGHHSHRPPFPFSILYAPLDILYTIFSRIFGVFTYVFPFLPRLVARLASRAASQRGTGNRTQLGPQDTTARFLREFREEYGAHHLPFLETGYGRAYDLAKKELKFLLAVPFSPEHDENSAFVRDILLSSQVTAFLNDNRNNLLLWAGSVQDSEAYQLAMALNVSKFPCAILIAHTPSVSSTAMSVIKTLSGLMSPQEFTAQLEAAMRPHSAALERTKASRREQDAARDLREQQNSAYEQSLAQDRERARQKREAKEAKEKAEKEELTRLQAEEKLANDISQWRAWRVQSMPNEPGPDAKDAVRLSLRLLDGTRVMRKFRPDAPIEEIYAFVECYDIIDGKEAISAHTRVEEPRDFQHKFPFRLVSPMPREVYGLARGGTIKDRVGRSGNIIVEKIEEGQYDSD